jgi:hypothetical protein
VKLPDGVLDPSTEGPDGVVVTGVVVSGAGVDGVVETGVVETGGGLVVTGCVVTGCVVARCVAGGEVVGTAPMVTRGAAVVDVAGRCCVDVATGAGSTLEPGGLEDVVPGASCELALAVVSGSDIDAMLVCSDPGRVAVCSVTLLPHATVTVPIVKSNATATVDLDGVEARLTATFR